MAKDNELYAYFSLIEFEGDPNLITDEIGLLPTKKWKKGDTEPKTQHERRFSRWALHSRLPKDQEFEDHITDVLNQLDTKQEQVKSVINKHENAILQLVGYFHSFYPGLYLESETVKRISDYGLSMDFDFYYLYSDSREDTD